MSSMSVVNVTIDIPRIKFQMTQAVNDYFAEHSAWIDSEIERQLKDIDIPALVKALIEANLRNEIEQKVKGRIYRQAAEISNELYGLTDRAIKEYLEKT